MSQIIAAGKQTVDTFSGILKKKIYLRNGGPPGNDGCLIQADFKSPFFYQEIEHQLSHLLFETNPAAQVDFVEAYVRGVTLHCSKQGRTINSEKLRYAVNTLVSILEKERVLSLWGRLYIGSEITLRHMFHEGAKELVPLAENGSLLALLGAIANGRDEVRNTAKPRFVDLFDTALEKVRNRSFSATLIVARWLVTQIVNELIEDKEDSPPPQQGSKSEQVQNGGDRAEALQRFIENEPAKLPTSYTNSIEDSKYSEKYTSNETHANARNLAQDAINTSVQDAEKLEAALARTEEHMDAKVEHVKNALTAPVKQDDWLRSKAMARVRFHDIGPEDVDTSHALSPERVHTVNKLRSRFFRVMGRRRVERAYMGTEIDLGAYIQHRATKQPEPVFKTQVSGQGFRILLLIDRSGSMDYPSLILRAEECCQVIAKALDFPFVQTEVWGFQGMKESQVDIVRFAPGLKQFHTKKVNVDGFTPLHTALSVARRHLDVGDEKKHIFVLTDGLPNFVARNDRYFEGKWIRGLVNKEVLGARQDGVGVTCAMIGRFNARLATYMREMFGPARHWRLVSRDSFENDLIRLVSQGFTDYLKR